MSKHIGIAAGLLVAAGSLYVFMDGYGIQNDQVTTEDDASPQVATAAKNPARKHPPLPAAQPTAGAAGSGSATGPVATATTQSTPSAPLPEPIHRRLAPPPAVDLWQVDPNDPQTTVDSIPATNVAVAPEVLDSLHVGQRVSMAIPSLNRTVTAEVTSTHNQLNNVAVFKGPITGGHDKDNVIITRGKTSTHVIVATREGVFSGVLDNGSGEGTLTDEGEINSRMRGLDDAVTAPGLEMTNPETAQNP
jgi:hypothetical protein